MNTTDDSDGTQVPPLEQQLEQVLRDAEEALADLRSALAEQRMRDRQHAEVGRLPEHLVNARVKWDQVRAFVDELIVELRGHDKDTGNGADSDG